MRSRPYWLTKELTWVLFSIPLASSVIFLSLRKNHEELHKAVSAKGRALTPEETQHLKNLRSAPSSGSSGTGGGYRRIAREKRSVEGEVKEMPQFLRSWWTYNGQQGRVFENHEMEEELLSSAQYRLERQSHVQRW